MTDQRFTPEEFARLLALPAGHPERVRAEQDPRFDAWRRMLTAFEKRDSHGLAADEIREADAALARRLEADLGIGTTALEAPRPTRRARDERESGRGLFGWLMPRWAPALAVATLMVAGGVWVYSARGPGERVVRGGEAGAPALTLSVRDGRDLTWSAVTGADEYRVTFLGPDLRELARLEGLTVTTLSLRSGSLPAELERGREIAVQVAAYREGHLLAESPATAVRVP